MLKWIFTMSGGSLTPVLEVVKDITIAQTSRSGLVALVSYEHNVCSLTCSTGGLLTTSILICRLGTSSALET
jgi:hypothetical protein